MKTPDSRPDYMLHMNTNQGEYRRVLFVCTGGILRSATAAHWAAEHMGWNTRSAGVLAESVPCVSQILVRWADAIYCMEQKHFNELVTRFADDARSKVTVLNIPDCFNYRDPELQALIAAALHDEPAS